MKIEESKRNKLNPVLNKEQIANFPLQIVVLFFFILTFPQNSLSEEKRTLQLTLKEAKKKVISQAHLIKAAQWDEKKSESQKEILNTHLYPTLSLEGQYRRISEVPKLNIGLLSTQIGDEFSYSFGPTLNYVIWDGGLARKTWESAQKNWEAKKEYSKSTEKSLTLKVQLLYLKTQLGVTESRLVFRSLKLAEKQLQDIQKKFQVGSASELDRLNATKEVSLYQLKLAQVNLQLKESLLDLFSLINENTEQVENIDFGREKSFEDDIQFDDLTLTLDFAISSISNFNERSTNFENTPQMKVLEKNIQAIRLLKDAKKAGYFPLISLQLRASLDYPNQMNLTQVQQKSLNLIFSLPLWESWRTKYQIDNQYFEEQMIRSQKENLRSEFKRDWEKSWSQVKVLKFQISIAEKNISDVEKVFQLTDVAFKNGRINLTELQMVHLRLLEARVNLARIQGQMLMNLYNINALSELEGEQL